MEREEIGLLSKEHSYYLLDYICRNRCTKIYKQPPHRKSLGKFIFQPPPLLLKNRRLTAQHILQLHLPN